MAIVWLMLAAVSAITRNVTRLAICLGYMLAHGLVVMYLRIKFSRFGSPTGPDGNDGSMVMPLERYADFHTQREAVDRGGSFSRAQMPFSGGLDRARSPNRTGATGAPACALGMPAFGLPMLYAVVGPCPPDCTCPFCCLTAAAAAGAADGLADPFNSTAGAQHYGRVEEAGFAHGLPAFGSGSLAPSGRVDELYLPGALLPEASPAPDLEPGPTPGQGPGLASMQTSWTRLSTDPGLLLAPLPPPLSPVSPSAMPASPSASPSGRPRSRAPARVVLEAAMDSGGSGGFSEGAAAAAAASGMGVAVGVPVARALLLVEGIPLVDVLRRRRAAARGGGGGSGGSSGGSPRAAPGQSPTAAQAHGGEEVAAAGSGSQAVSRAVGEGEHQQQLQEPQSRQRQRGRGDPAVAEVGDVGGSALSAAAAAPQEGASVAAAAASSAEEEGEEEEEEEEGRAPGALSMGAAVGRAAVGAVAGDEIARVAP